MSTLSEINFNYQRAVRQASQLDDIARRLKTAATADMENILAEVNRAWQSDSTPQYIAKGRKVKGDISTTAQNLKDIASAIRTIAERVRAAELEAWRVAHERNS